MDIVKQLDYAAGSNDAAVAMEMEEEEEEEEGQRQRRLRAVRARFQDISQAGALVVHARGHVNKERI